MTFSIWIIFSILIFGTSGSTNIPTLKLLNGREIPVVGFGTAVIGDEDTTVRVISTALESGYRHFDTAFSYKSEKGIGIALKNWFANGGKREELFITSKLPSYGNRPEDVSRFLEMSLKDLGLDYVDMYLIHHPFGYHRTEDNERTTIDLTTNLTAIWKEMEKYVKAGKIKAIGVSNFNKTQVMRLWDTAEIKPSNVEIENHLYLQQDEFVKFLQGLGIVVTGYAPLGSSGITHVRRKRETKVALLPLIRHPLVQEIANKHSKSTAQILLRYNIQRNMVIIPKSSHPKRIKENIDLFDFNLTDDDMNKLKQLDQHGKYRKFDFLTRDGAATHPEYPFSDRLY